jgi:Fic family protein
MRAEWLDQAKNGRRGAASRLRFEGRMTSSKWAIIAKCSQDTANRDITALLDLGLLRKGEGGGRSTHYELVL